MLENGPNMVNMDTDFVSSGARDADIFAAIDLGTNNCRLLVAERQGDGFRVIDAFSRIVCLGERLAETGVLNRKAQDRALDALEICARKLRKFDVKAVRAVATQACREAANSQNFVRRVRQKSGLSLEVISEAEEARLAIGGCQELLDRDAKYSIVFDIGGGSTEVIWVDNSAAHPVMIDSLSLPIGVVSLGEKIGSGRISQERYDQEMHYIQQKMQVFSEKNDMISAMAAHKTQLIGTSGTVTTLTGMHLNLRRYNRAQVDGQEVPVASLMNIARRLSQLSRQERAAIPSVGARRSDVVVAGCIIANAICETWPMETMSVADRGIREGILQDLFQQSA